MYRKKKNTLDYTEVRLQFDECTTTKNTPIYSHIFLRRTTTSIHLFSLSSRSGSLSLSLTQAFQLRQFWGSRIFSCSSAKCTDASRLAIRSFALNSSFGICCCCCFCCCCDSDFGRGWRCAIKIRTTILCSSLNYYWQTDRQTFTRLLNRLLVLFLWGWLSSDQLH